MKSRVIILSLFAAFAITTAALSAVFIRSKGTAVPADKAGVLEAEYSVREDSELSGIYGEEAPENMTSSEGLNEDDAVKTEDLSAQNTKEGELPLAETPETGETRVPLEKYKDILSVNPYVSGWLTIEGISLDEPVIYTPKSQNYFLHRTPDGAEHERGSLFIAINWKDNYGNTLIYGHNMKDGTAFGSLQRFADENFGKAHPYMWFDSLYEEHEYELVAAFYSQIDEEELETADDREEKDMIIMAEGLKNRQKKQEEEQALTEYPASETEPGAETAAEPEPELPPVTEADVTLADLDLYTDMGDIDIYRQEKDEDNGRFRYYYYTDLSDKADFDYYVENVKARALYDTGVDVNYGDQLITLSTCSYQVKNGRFVVVAKRIN
ncbi:MAG: class B sortase [Lachnospiraceae bacterium]|nr:class B sortase [Lachnospiraceae bacterium]